jgi:hypothetical protein
VIAPPRGERHRAADIKVLFEAARRRRRRRRRLAGAVSCVLVAGAVALALTAGWPRHGAVARPRPAAVAAAAPSFRLPAATVGWVDYNGQLHVGDVATLAQHAVANVRAVAGIGQLVQAGGYLYAGGSAVIRRFDPATGQIRPVARGAAVFASADGQRLFVPQSASSLMVLPASGRGTARRLMLPAGWYIDPQYLPAQTVAGGVVVESRPGGPSRPPASLAVWNPATGTVRVIAPDGGAVRAASTAPGARYSLLAWQTDTCLLGNCPIEITNTASLSTVTVRSPLHAGFTGLGAAFSPDGTRLAVFARTAPVSSLTPGLSELAVVSTRTGRVRTVPGVRLDTPEDAGWVLWLPGGDRLLAGALQGSYAVDTTTYAARPFFFFPAVSDHDIMNTPDVNFSAALLPARR